MRKMRKFEVRYINEFSFVTEWMNENQKSFDYLREEVKPIAENYLNFVKSFNKDVKGLSIRYYALDGDDFGDGNVVKWSITFENYSEEGIKETLDGLTKTDFYEVIRFADNKVLFYGTLADCWRYMEENYKEFDFDKEEELLKFSEIIKAVFKESKYEIQL